MVSYNREHTQTTTFERKAKQRARKQQTTMTSDHSIGDKTNGMKL